MVLALELCESCCLEIVCSRRHFQLSSRGKEKQFHAWATVNPSLSVPLLDALKSHPTPSPSPHPFSHQPLLFCDQGEGKHQPRSEIRMRFTCSLTILSSLMSFTSVPWHLQFPALQWNAILHAGVVTAFSYNIPSPLSIRLHAASCQSMINTLDSTLLPPFLLYDSTLRNVMGERNSLVKRAYWCL